jgi:hypothetical protein
MRVSSRPPFPVGVLLVGCLALSGEAAAAQNPRSGQGKDQRTWHRRLSPAEVNALVRKERLRIVDLRATVDGASRKSLFDVAVIKDTVEQPWSWSFDLTPERARAVLEASPRVPVKLAAYELAPGDVRLAALWAPGRADALTGWVVLVDQTAKGVKRALAAGRLKLKGLVAYTSGSGRRFALVARAETAEGARRLRSPSRSPLDAPLADDITARVSALLAVTDGTQGLHLKELGGAILAEQNRTFAFEPASTIKAAAGLHVMQQVEAGTWAFGNLVDVFQPPASGSCPTNTDIGDETLTVAMQEMLWHSDNQRTRVIVDTFGAANINATMAASGMGASSINHVIGCGGPPENRLTLADAGVLYEGSADGTLVDAANREQFHNFFAGRGQFEVEGYDWTGIWDTDIPNMIVQEQPAGMTASQRAFYRNEMDLAYKAGNYKICVNASCSDYRDHISIAGWAEVPFCSGTAIDPREFAFGLFIYNSTSDLTSGQAFTSAKGELLREQIRDGMASCFHAELSTTSTAAPDPVISDQVFTVTIDAANAGPMEATSVSLAGATPPGTTFASAAAAPGWSTTVPAVGGTGAFSFSRNPMAIAESPEFQVSLRVDCAVPDGTAISVGSAIASASTPDLNPADNQSTAQVSVSNPAPVLGPASASPAVLWPPNHKMVEVAVDYAVADNCGTPSCSLTVVSSEPDNGGGDGNTTGDIQVVDAHHLRLRAERSGGGPGRTYTITASCSDSGGGSSSTQTAVVVPHNR